MSDPKILSLILIGLLSAACGEDDSSGKNSKRTTEGPMPIIRVKPENAVDPKVRRQGKVVLTGSPFIPTNEPKEALYYYKGNASLLALLKRVKLNNANGTALDNSTMEDAVVELNGAIPEDSNWKIIVADNAAKLRISGEIANELVPALASLMKKNRNFHCVITDGIVEFRKGDVPKDSLIKKLTPLPAEPHDR